MKKPSIIFLIFLLCLAACVPMQNPNDGNTTDSTTITEENTTAEKNPPTTPLTVSSPENPVKGKKIEEIVPQLIPLQTTHDDVVALLGMDGEIAGSGIKRDRWYFEDGTILLIHFHNLYYINGSATVQFCEIQHPNEVSELQFSSVEDIQNFILAATGSEADYQEYLNQKKVSFVEYDVAKQTALALSKAKIPIPKDDVANIEVSSLTACTPHHTRMLCITYKIGDFTYYFDYSTHLYDADWCYPKGNDKEYVFITIPVDGTDVVFHNVFSKTMVGYCTSGDFSVSISITNEAFSPTAFDIFDFVSFPTADQ